MNSATIAAPRLTTDSAASDSRPTDPVSSHAPDFRPIVTIAAAIDIHAYRVRLGREFTDTFSQHAGPRSNRPSARDARCLRHRGERGGRDGTGPQDGRHGEQRPEERPGDQREHPEI